MDFEDIVDMDWLNSHTFESTCLPSPPLLKEEQDTNMNWMTTTDVNMFNQQDTVVIPNVSMIGPTTMSKDMMIMPSTDQIKQLIELAKKHLALREQLSATIPSSSSLSSTSSSSEPTPEPEPPLSPSSQTTATIKLEEIFSPANNSTTTTTTVGILDTVSPESLIKSDDDATSVADINPPINNNSSHKSKRGSLTNNPHLEDGTIMSLETYAELDGIDITKLSSKERRQLRNKISARNFRVRRKEYITTLEGQVNDHKNANEKLLHRLNIVEEENKQLKLEIDSLKRQNLQLSENRDLCILGTTTTTTDTYHCPETTILVS
ncbi:MAG: hypothetical protein EXX96DRAFT_650740 [Benjaminiella poitrasii]|nr:MAG: hypothetical protein EXX96DRAFT_650740 [Benjaminiella poitrasii]